MSEIPASARHPAWNNVKGIGEGIVVEEYSWHYRIPVFTEQFCDELTRLFDGSDGDTIPLIALSPELDTKASAVAAAAAGRMVRHLYGDRKIILFETGYSVIHRNKVGDPSYSELGKGTYVLQVCLGDDCEGGEYFSKRYGEAAMRVIRPEQGYGILRPAAMPYSVMPVKHGALYELFFYFDLEPGEEQCDS